MDRIRFIHGEHGIPDGISLIHARLGNRLNGECMRSSEIPEAVQHLGLYRLQDGLFAMHLPTGEYPGRQTVYFQEVFDL